MCGGVEGRSPPYVCVIPIGAVDPARVAYNLKKIDEKDLPHFERICHSDY